MPNKPIITINVNDDQFKAFTELFDKHQEKVQALPKEWEKISGTASEGSEAMAAAIATVTAGLMEAGKHAHLLSSHLHSASEAQRQFGVASRQGAVHMHSMAKDAKTLADRVFGIGKFLFKVGVLGGASGLLGGFGLDKLAQSAVSNQRGARSLGLSTGQYRAFGTDFGRYVDPSALENIANAKNDYLGRIWLQRATGMSADAIQSQDAGTLAGSLAMKAHDWWKKTPAAQRTSTNLQTAGFTELGFSLDDMRRLGAASKEELAQAQRQYQADSKRLNITDRSTDALFTFRRDVLLAGQSLETALSRRLAQLGPSLGGLITVLEKDAEILINKIFTPQHVQAIEHGVDQFTKFLGSDVFKKDMDTFLGALDAVASALWKFAKWLAPNSGLTDPNAPGSSSTNSPAMKAEAPTGIDYWRNPDNGNPKSLLWHAGNYKKLIPARLPTMLLPANEREYMGPYYENVNPDTSKGQQNLAWLASVEKAHHLPKGLLSSVINTESSFNKHAISPAGAEGAMQLLPSVQKQYGVKDPFNFKQNVEGGAQYLEDLSKRFHDDLRKALAGYNWGPNRKALNSDASDWESKINPGVEAYVNKVMAGAGLGKPIKVEVHMHNKTGTNVAVSANAARL